MKNKVQTIFKFNYYGCEKSYNQHRVQIECDDTCNYEHHCRSKSARSSRRSGLWLIVGILLPVRRSRLPDPDGHGGCGAGGHVLRQTGRCIPLGRRSVRRTHGISRHLASVDRIDDLVPDGTDLRRRIDRLYRHERNVRHVTCVEQGLHANSRIGYLLGRNTRFSERHGLGRQNQQMGRYDRYDHTGRSAHSSGHHLHFDRRP